MSQHSKVAIGKEVFTKKHFTNADDGYVRNMSQWSDDTYSVMFAALKHPIRRHILRSLGTSAKSFSELLRELEIDSGHLSHHIKVSEELLMKMPDDRYSLSSIGRAALDLLAEVEEARSGLQDERRSILLKPTILALSAILLIVMGAILATETTVVASRPFDLIQQISIPAEQSWTQNVTRFEKYHDGQEEQPFGFALHEGNFVVESAPALGFAFTNTQELLSIEGRFLDDARIRIVVLGPDGKLEYNRTVVASKDSPLAAIPLRIDRMGVYSIRIINISQVSARIFLLIGFVRVETTRPLIAWAAAAFPMGGILFFLSFQELKTARISERMQRGNKR